ncbi:MAG TPA: hypothetical protein VF600_18160 [Abditibacteriaceae bacterium]
MLRAQPASAQEMTALNDPTIVAIESGVERGRIQLTAGDVNALQTLQTTARQAAQALRTVTGNAVSGAVSGNDVMPDGLGNTGTISPAEAEKAAFLRGTAARAHFWWGRAEDTLGDRDRAITALARAVSFAGRPPVGSPSTQNEIVARDATQRLNAILREGLPLVAPDDTLEIIAAQAHGGLWQPRRISFQLPPLTVRPALRPSATARLSGRDVLAEVARSRELLVTSGKLFPAQRRTSDGSIRLWRTPPLYNPVKPTALPAALRMDRVSLGYIREVDGPNAGLWRQVVRVFYASPYLTRGNRDDRPRAEILCEQFLKVASLVQAQTRLTNPYAADGVTTVWLAETSAWWPADDEEPAMAALLPMRQLPLNTALRRGERLVPEVQSSPLNRPWRAGAWIDSAPDEIMLFKMTEPRGEAEWLRELIHEYSHIALPPFAGFRPPLEPFGNGALGECLGMMWAAGNTAAFAPRDNNATASQSPAEDAQKMRTEILRHVERNALPSLRLFLAQGPSATLSRSGTQDGLRYLQGLSVYLDRVYGPTSLQRAFGPLSLTPRPAQRSVTTTRRRVGLTGRTITTSQASVSASAASATRSVAARAGYTAVSTADSLLQTSATWMRNPFARGEARFAVWLGGALMKPSKGLTSAELAERAPLQLRAGERVSGWIFVPSAATSLRMQGAGVAQIKVPDGWTTTSHSGAASTGTSVLVLRTSERTGWQRLTLLATRDTTINGAWFERASP